MSRFDRADPALDPDYCNDLAPEPFDEDRAELGDDRFELGDITTYCPPAPSLSAMPGYGLAVLHYLLMADRYLFGMVDDHGLQCADHSALIAVASVDISELALNKISAVRMEIAVVLSRRAHERRHENAPSVAVEPVTPADRPSGDGGSREPARPKPLSPSPSTFADERMRF